MTKIIWLQYLILNRRRLKALQATEAYTNDYEYIIQMIIVMYT